MITSVRTKKDILNLTLFYIYSCPSKMFEYKLCHAVYDLYESKKKKNKKRQNLNI